MSQLRRMLLSNVGYRSAYYAGILLDFCNAETQQPENSVIWLANQGGKTTLISLLFTNVEPRVGRFVQQLQKKDHRFADYFYATPGVVALELQTGGADLMGATPPVIIGQCVVVQEGGQATQRVFFAYFANDNITLESLPFKGIKATSQVNDYVHNMAAFKHWLGEAQALNSTVFFTENQHDWKKQLDAMGIEHELLAKQVDFCRSEGGISDFASFKGERAFLEQFFTLALDEEKAKQAYEALCTAHQQYKEMPKLEEMQGIYASLLKGFQRIQPSALNYQRCDDEMTEANDQLMSLVREIKLRQLWLNKEIDELEKQKTKCKEEWECNQQALFKHNHTIKCTKLSLLIHTCFQAKETAKQEGEKKQQAEKRLVLFKAVVALEALQKSEIEHETLENTINDANHEIAPTKKALKNTGSQLIACYQHLIDELQRQRMSIRTQIAEIKEHILQQKREEKGLQEKRDNENKTLASSERWLDMYADHWGQLKTRGRLTTNEGEELDVIQAKSYWHDQYTQKMAADEEVTATKNELHDRLTKYDKRLATLNKEVTVLETQLELLNKDANFAQEERDQLKVSADLCKLMKVGQVNPDDVSLLLDLSQWIEGMQQQIENNRRRINELINQKEWLEKDRLAKPDSTIEHALTWLEEQGVDACYYPHYLGRQQLSVEEAKALVESDPARFYGIQVNSLQTIHHKIALIDREKLGLSRPVVISEGCTTIVEQPNNVVLPTRNDAAYNEKAGEALLDKINNELTRFQVEQATNKALLAEKIPVQERLKSYQATYGKAWFIQQEQQVANKQQSLSEKKQERQSTEAERDKIDQAIKELSGALKAFTEQAHTANGHHSAITDFIDHFESQKSIETKKKEDAALSIEHLETNIKVVEKSIIALSDDELRRNEDESRLSQSINDNTGLLGKVNHKNNDITVNSVVIPMVDVSYLQSEYDALLKSYHALMDDNKLAELKGELKSIAKNLTEKRKRYLQAKTDYSDADIEDEKNRINNEGSELQHLVEQQETFIQQHIASLGKYQHIQENAQQECNKYQREHPDVTALETPSSKRELEALLKKTTNETEKIGDEIVRLDELSNMLTTKMKDYDSEQKQIAIGLKPLSEDVLPNVLVSDEALSLAVAIEHEKVLDEIAVLIQVKKQKVTKQSQIKNQISSCFRKVILPIVENSEKSALIGATATDIRLYSTTQLIKDSAKHILTMQDRLNAIESKIQINKDKSMLFHSSFNRLLDDADDALQAACKVRIPDDMLHYSKQPILKSNLLSKNKLRTTLSEEQRKSLYLNHLSTVVERHSVDENGYKLAAAFLLKAYKMVLPAEKLKKKDNILNIRIIKPHDVEVEYIPVDKMVGSGGEGLTAGLLLYLVIANIRGMTVGKGSIGKSGSFLLLDNPFSKANKVDLIRPQTELAKKLNIQLIFATGIEDLNAIGEFEHVIRLRKDRMDMHSKRQYIEHEEAMYNQQQDTAKHAVNLDKYRIQSIAYSYNSHVREDLEAK